MAKNIKKQSSASRFGPAMCALVVCVFIGGAGVGYVWQKNQVQTLGTTKKHLELRLADLRRQNKIRGDQLAFQRLPVSLELRARELKLGLGPPTQEQIWTLTDAPVAAPAPVTEKRIVAQLNQPNPMPRR